MDVISWLGAFHVKNEVYEKAMPFFDLAAKIQPAEIKWQLMVASCYRRIGAYPQALATVRKAGGRRCFLSVVVRWKDDDHIVPSSGQLPESPHNCGCMRLLSYWRVSRLKQNWLKSLNVGGFFMGSMHCLKHRIQGQVFWELEIFRFKTNFSYFSLSSCLRDNPLEPAILKTSK